MADQTPSFLDSQLVKRSKSNRMNLLRKLKPQKTSSESLDLQPSLPPLPFRVSTPSSPTRMPSFYATEGPLSSAELIIQFSNLHNDIVAHVRKFYSDEGAEKAISQSVIENASIGISLPWSQVLELLGDANTRMAMLAMCIAWTILSRSLLLKLGISNGPGSTFLPPEVVECFQSFSFGKGVVILGQYETNSMNFALLSRWKQTTAVLCHNAYIANAFSFFDGRTVNIERALKDLDPLLTTYAIPHNAGHGQNARLDDLRGVLQHGAFFAFTLFGQPCFWNFDWRSDRATAHGKSETELDPERTSNTASIGIATNTPNKLTTQEVVAWPSLVKIIDEDGFQLSGHGDDIVLGKKTYIVDLALP